MPSKYHNFETRKSVHVNLTKETHAAFRAALFHHGLSMQEVFEECAIRIVENDDSFEGLIEELQERKRGHVRKKMAKTDAESIFQAIEDQNPMEDLPQPPDKSHDW